MLSRNKGYFFILLFNTLLVTVDCNLSEEVRSTVAELEERSRRLYGNAQKRPIKQWELDEEDTLFYPNGDQQKLAEISQLWIDYYHCISRTVDCMTSSGHLPSTNVMVYEGAVARLSCGVCVAPGEDGDVRWFYAKSITNVTFTPFGEKSTVTSNVNLTLYNVQMEDAGVYRCQVGGSVSGLVVLEVLDDEKYDVIDNKSYPRHNSVIKESPNTSILHKWSPWSECSRCDSVGTRRRYGMCYVEITERNTTESNLSRDIHKLFQEFPSGVACKSLLLSSHLNSTSFKVVKNIIMTEMCKMPCKRIFEVRSKTGELIERANNSAGVYSINQELSPQPPPPVRDVIFVECGERLILKCPGTTLRDTPITWRAGAQNVDESIAKKTGGRINLTARGYIVFYSVEWSDANVYSCWQSTNVAGVLKVEVWRDARFANGRPIVITSLIIVAIATHTAVKLLQAKVHY